MSREVGRAVSGPGLTLRRVGLMAESFLPLLPRPPRQTVRRGFVTDSPPGQVSIHRFGDDSAPEGVELTLLAANLKRGERDGPGLAAAIAAVDADLLLLCEHTAATRDALAAAGTDQRWPHRSDAADEGHFGTLVASRHPILAAEQRDLGGRPGQVVDLDVDGLAVRVVPVHTQAPVHDRDVAVWHAGLTATAAVAAEVPGPVVLAGDWNATGGHRHFRRELARHGLVDASAARGHRWFPTWPVESRALPLPVPPLLTLDHVVVRADVEIAALDRLTLPGSDHRGLRATLRLPRP